MALSFTHYEFPTAGSAIQFGAKAKVILSRDVQTINGLPDSWGNEYSLDYCKITGADNHTALPTLHPIKMAWQDEDGQIKAWEVNVDFAHIDKLYCQTHIGLVVYATTITFAQPTDTDTHEDTGHTRTITSTAYSLLDAIFAGFESHRYFLWVVYIRPDAVEEYKLCGEIQVEQIQRDHSVIRHETSSAEWQRYRTSIQVLAEMSTLEKTQVSALQAALTADDMVTDTPVPFFAGIIPQPASPDVDAQGFFEPWDNVLWDTYMDIGSDWHYQTYPARETTPPLLPDHSDDVNANNDVLLDDDNTTIVHMVKADTGGPTPRGSFPRGTWGVTLAKVLEKIAEVCRFDTFNSTTDFDSPYEFAKQTLVNGSYVLPSPWDTYPHYQWDAVDVTAIVVHYNYTFGVSPYDGSKITTPLGINADSVLSDLLKKIMLQFGCVVHSAVNQSTGQQKIILISRHASLTCDMTSWKLLGDSKESSHATPKTHVEITLLGTQEGGLKCPAKGGMNAAKIELPWRVHPFGRNVPTFPGLPGYPSTWDPEFVTLDSGRPMSRQWEVLKRGAMEANSNTHLNGDSWGLGAFLYFLNDADTNIAFPSDWTNNTWFWNPLLNGYVEMDQGWRGLYPLAACTEKSGVWTDRGDMLHAPAQLYAREIIKPPLIINRRYGNPHDADGSILTVVPGIVASWYYLGQVRNWRAVNVELDIINGFADITWREIPSTTPDDLPVAKIGDDTKLEGSISGAAGGGTTPDPIASSGLRTLYSVDYAVDTLAHMISDNPSITYQLIFFEGSAEDNGIYVVQPMAASYAKMNVVFPSGCEIYAEESYNNNHGQNSIWQLYGFETGVFVNPTVNNADTTKAQYWRRADRINNLWDGPASKVTDGGEYAGNLIPGGIYMRSSDGSLNFTGSFTDPGGSGSTGEPIPGFDVTVNFPAQTIQYTGYAAITSGPYATNATSGSDLFQITAGIIAGGNLAITLNPPAAAGTGYQAIFIITQGGLPGNPPGYTVTITPATGTINGAATFTMTAVNGILRVAFIWNGMNWLLMP